MDWIAIAKTTRTAFGKSVDEWLIASRIQGGSVRGPNAELTPGSLASSSNFEQRMLATLQAGRVPAVQAQILARELAHAWRAWADGFRMSLPGAYPKLAAVPGPAAPPTPAAGAYPLARGSSAGEYQLQKDPLATRLRSAFKQPAGRDAAFDKAVQELAGWVDASFREWKQSAQIVGLAGKGPVPTWAPPYVPVGPVVGGDNMTTIGPAIAGPRFGRPIP